MGGRMSRRRERDDQNNEDLDDLESNQERGFYSPVEEDNDEDETQEIETNDLAASILAYILRNRRQNVSVLNTGLGFSSINIGNESGDDSDDVEEFRMRYFHQPVSPQAEPCPDTSRIENSRIHDEIAVATGSLLDTQTNITNSILERQVGAFKGVKRSRGHFTNGVQVGISDNFLPNSVEIMNKYRQKVFCGKYSTDGSVFLSACQDQHIRLYETSNGRFTLFRDIVARDVGWSVVDTAYSPDQRFLIYTSWCDCIHLCNIYGDFETHIPLNLRPEESRFCAFSVCFSQDNTQILAGGSDQCIYVYDRGSDKRTLRISGHEDDVNSVAFANEASDILYSGSDDGLCMVWDRRALNERDPRPVGVFAGHKDGITYIDAKGDGRYLISNSKDQTIKLWDMRRFASKDSVKECKQIVAGTNWDYRWESAPRRSRRLTQISGDPSIMTYRGHSVLQTLIRARFSPAHSTGQKYIYTGCATGNVVLYDVLTGKIAAKLKGHKQCVRDISWHPYEQKIISSSWDFTVGLWQYRPLGEEHNFGIGKPKKRRTARGAKWSLP